MAKRQTFTREKVEEIREYFKNLPAIEKKKSVRSIQKAQTIAELKAEISALLTRGHSMQIIVQALSGKSVEIDSTIINNYRNRLKPPAFPQTLT